MKVRGTFEDGYLRSQQGSNSGNSSNSRSSSNSSRSSSNMNIRRKSSSCFEKFRFILILSLTLTEQVEAGFRGAWFRHHYTGSIGKYMKCKIMEKTHADLKISEIGRGGFLEPTEWKIYETKPLGMPRSSVFMPMVREVNMKERKHLEMPRSSVFRPMGGEVKMEERKDNIKRNNKRFLRVFKKSAVFSK